MPADDPGRVAPTTPVLELVAEITAFISRPVEAGRTGAGLRRIVPITGGRVSGGAFEGEIQPGGSDIQVVRRDGVAEIEARYVITTPRDTHVYVENIGVARLSSRAMEQMMQGATPDPAGVYFRSTPRFETDDPELAWVERDLFVASALPRSDRVRIDVYRVG